MTLAGNDENILGGEFGDGVMYGICPVANFCGIRTAFQDF